MRIIRKTLGVLIALGLIGFGVVAFIGQAGIAERGGNMDDFYAGLVMGGLGVFAGLVTLYITLKTPKKPANMADTSATVWAVGMTTMADDDGGFDSD